MRTGGYTLVDLAAQYSLANDFDVVFGFMNLVGPELRAGVGFPQPGRTFYLKTRIGL